MKAKESGRSGPRIGPSIVGPRPLTLIEGRRVALQARLAAALSGASLDGWEVVQGWGAPLTGERVICTGTISTADDARRALLAAMAGAGLVAGLDASRQVIDRLVDELRSLGPVHHVVLDEPPD
jgi:hypothetical protein